MCLITFEGSLQSLFFSLTVTYCPKWRNMTFHLVFHNLPQASFSPNINCQIKGARTRKRWQFYCIIKIDYQNFSNLLADSLFTWEIISAQHQAIIHVTIITSEDDMAPSRSCLFARTSTGTPWFSADRVIRLSSTLASSMRSVSAASTTNTRPSVLLVYDFQRGLSFSWPPTSHTWNVVVLVLELPIGTLIHSMLKPLVGIVSTNSRSLSL